MKGFIIVFLLIGLLFLAPYQLKAGSFTVIPIKVFLEEKKTATISVTNNGEEKVNVQVRAVEWSQDEEGRDKFSPTKEIIFFPKIFAIEKGEERIVRIGYQGERPVMEKTYRIFFRELPVKKAGETALKMALRIGMPVFITPANKIEKIEIEKISLEEVKPSEESSGQKAEGSEQEAEPPPPKRMVVVRVRNKGNVHVSPRKIKAMGFDESGKEVFSKEVAGWYVLSGVSKPFAIEISPQECQESRVIKVSVQTKESSLDAELELDRTMCGH
ncbi:MAG: fimbria/pilus periplasmic chaperone [bacterium]|nr:fimbria/pilus periplasmic chaperone [bacterium]